MGVDLHITRAALWAENEQAAITADEWLRYVASDPELRHDTRNGPYMVLWAGPSAYAEPWLDWYNGNIYTKWPDTALYGKMLQIAAALQAKVQDDEGTDYANVGDWIYDPASRIVAIEKPKHAGWWRRLLKRE